MTSSYKENVMKLSAILKDSPMPPLDYVLHWIEYVIKHDGAKHLRPAVLDISWYQYLLLDVLLLLTGIAASGVFISFYICRKCFCKKSIIQGNSKIEKSFKKD